MTISMYNASVPVFKQMLNSMSHVLSKAEAHAAEKKIDPAVFLQARLYPDMFPLLRQVQIAADFAKGVSARLRIPPEAWRSLDAGSSAEAPCGSGSDVYGVR